MAILLSFFSSLLLSIIFSLLAKKFCLLMQANDDTLNYATIYLRILSIGFLFNGLRMTINACQKGIGKTKISMISNLIANIVNVLLNYVLITGKFGFPRLEIVGAAIATVIGNFIAFLISFISVIFDKKYLRFSFKKIFKFDKFIFDEITKLIPSILIEQVFMRIGFIIYGIIVNKLGTEDTYVHGICSDINSILFTLEDGFAIGASAIIGHKLGEKRKDLAIVYSNVCLMLSILVAILIMTCIIVFKTELVLLYKPDSLEKLEKAKRILLLVAISMIPQNIQWIYSSILRSSGDTKYTAFISFISVTVIRPLTAYLLCYILFGGLGIYGAWYSHLIDQAVRMICNIFRFNSRKWINIKV